MVMGGINHRNNRDSDLLRSGLVVLDVLGPFDGRIQIFVENASTTP